MLDELFELVLASADDYAPTQTAEMKLRQQFISDARSVVDRWVNDEPEPLAGFAWRTQYGGAQGNVGPVPWMRVYDAAHSPRTTEGYYLCWLFAGDGSAVHLSLNQGTSEFRANKWRPITDSRIIAAQTEAARSSIIEWPARVFEDGAETVDLGTDSLNLGHEALVRIRNYEVGHIAGFTYLAGAIPSDVVLQDDFRTLLPMLAELYDPMVVDGLGRRAESGATGGTPRPVSAGGQGRSSNRALNVAVELRAMRVVSDHYSDAWEVTDVSAFSSFDLLLARDDEEVHVEVKGTTTAGTTVSLPHTEVRHAEEFPHCVLAVVSGISVSDGANGPVASGGSLTLYDPWKIETERLFATQYRYDLQGLHGETLP